MALAAQFTVRASRLVSAAQSVIWALRQASTAHSVGKKTGLPPSIFIFISAIKML
jgi:hypothetical protein